MSCEEILAEMTARRVEGEERRPAPEIAEHLAACAACRAEAEALGELWEGLGRLEVEPPAAELRERFDAVLAAYRAGLAAAGAGAGAPAGAARRAERPGRRRRLLGSAAGGLTILRQASPGRPLWLAGAAAVALALGVGLGALLANRGAGGDVQALRGEVRALHELVALSLLEAPSAAERLQGVSFGSRLERPEREVVAALVAAATGDPSVNVRLAAIEALAPLAAEPRVLAPLVRALPEQESPLVQVALVDLLLASDGETARRAASALLADEAVHPEVRRHVEERLGQVL